MPIRQIHKLLAGLVDQYQLSGDERAHRELALSMARDLADYFVQRIHDVIAEKGAAHWQARSDRVTLVVVCCSLAYNREVSSLPPFCFENIHSNTTWGPHP